MRTLFLLTLMTCAVEYCPGQQAGATKAFEVASIKPCSPGTPAPAGQGHGMDRFTYPGGRFEARATSVMYLFEWAYNLLPSQHSSGPGWMETDRYDIVAKGSGNPTDEEMKLMTQTLLAERFRLKFRRESREAPVLILEPGKVAPRLFPPKVGEKRALEIAPHKSDDGRILGYSVVATNFSFADLNRTFARQMDRVILNRTGVEGDFDFSFDLMLDDDNHNPLDPAVLIGAMRDQLGLTIKSQKAPVDYLTIESVEKAAGNE